MLFNDFVTVSTRFLFAVACVATTYLYFYPVWLGCGFPSTDGKLQTTFQNTFFQHVSSTNLASSSTLAPFRLLVLADPQLEGDSSLPDPEDALFRKLAVHWDTLTRGHDLRDGSVYREVVKEIIAVNIPDAVKAIRKRVDLFGNDYYLAHIFRTLHWWTKPTHVTVLGDLIGSQWVDQEEFAWRGWRYWNRVFARGHKVEEEIMNMHQIEGDSLLRMDDSAWHSRIINIAGNHDIGYAGDISRTKMDRFEDTYGRANWDVRFQYPESYADGNQTSSLPSLHLVVLNSMLLDTPAMDEELQTEVYEYLNSVITERSQPVEDRSSFTLLLTHVPLHKEEGTCVDAPFFDFWGSDNCDGQCKPHALKEQNHLSSYSSRQGLLEALFGMSGKSDAPMQGKGRSGLVLNGHDHEGCDVWHHVPANSTMQPEEDGEEAKTNWQATRWKEADLSSSHTGIREVTLRSMMGDYGGNAGLLSAWFDFDEGEWQYDVQMCTVGVQHVWWAVHILDAIVLGLLAVRATQSLSRGMTDVRHFDQRSNFKSTKVD